MMKTLSKKEIFIIAAPLISGVLFVAAVYINHILFDNQLINARQAVGHEILFFLTGLVIILVQLPLVIKWLINKQWKPALLCIISAIIFFVCIMFGGSQGKSVV